MVEVIFMVDEKKIADLYKDISKIRNSKKNADMQRHVKRAKDKIKDMLNIGELSFIDAKDLYEAIDDAIVDFHEQGERREMLDKLPGGSPDFDRSNKEVDEIIAENVEQNERRSNLDGIIKEGVAMLESWTRSRYGSTLRRYAKDARKIEKELKELPASERRSHVSRRVEELKPEPEEEEEELEEEEEKLKKDIDTD